MKNYKFEIILAYYKRPKIVLNALESILKSTYSNWHLTFIDDSGDDSFKESLLSFGFDNSKVTYVPIMMPDDEKIEIGGSIHGEYMNQSIKKTDSDIIIILCDDDAFSHDYMENLNSFFNKNPNEMWAYSHVRFFNPDKEHYSKSKEVCEDISLNKVNLNENFLPINPYCKVDSAQVVFKRDAYIKKNVWYPSPATINLDAYIFNKMFSSWGPCMFTGFFGQNKGWFENQMGVRHRAGKGDFIN